MKYVFLFLLLACLLQVNAQTTWSLDECINYTLENHPAVAVYENNRSIAEEQTTQSIADYLPQVTGSATFTDNLKLQTTILPAGVVGPEAAEVRFGTEYNTVVGVDFSQTIFDQSKIVGIKAGKPYEKMTRLQEEQNKESLIYNTAQAYFQVLIYEEQIAILETNKAKYEEMVATLEYQLIKGVVLKKDVDRVQVNLNSTDYQIQDATTKHQLAVNRLKYSMGMSFDSTLVVEENIDYEMFADVQMSDDLVLEKLTPFKINEQQIALQEISVKMQKSSYTPTLNFVGKYASQSMNNDFDDAFSNWNDFSYIGLSFKLPIYTGFSRNSKLHEEQLKLENERNNFKINQQNLLLNFENAQTSVGTAYSSFLSNRDNLYLAKELLNVTEYQYEEGTVNLIDYLNDDAAYKTAQSNYINSLYNLMITQLDYQKSQGTLSEFISTLK